MSPVRRPGRIAITPIRANGVNQGIGTIAGRLDFAPLRLKRQSMCSIRLAGDTICGYTVSCRDGGWHREAIGKL
jgi:hypothetical protein